MPERNAGLRAQDGITPYPASHIQQFRYVSRFMSRNRGAVTLLQQSGRCSFCQPCCEKYRISGAEREIQETACLWWTGAKRGMAYNDTP